MNRLPIGSRLPTHRDLAYHLKVTVGTVTRALCRSRTAWPDRRGSRARDLCPGGHAGQCHGFWPQLPLPQSVSRPVVDLSVCTPSSAGVAEALAAMFTNMSNPAGFQRTAGIPAPWRTAEHTAPLGRKWLRRHQLSIGPENVLVTQRRPRGSLAIFHLDRRAAGRSGPDRAPDLFRHEGPDLDPGSSAGRCRDG